MQLDIYGIYTLFYTLFLMINIRNVETKIEKPSLYLAKCIQYYKSVSLLIDYLFKS